MLTTGTCFYPLEDTLSTYIYEKVPNYFFTSPLKTLIFLSIQSQIFCSIHHSIHEKFLFQMICIVFTLRVPLTPRTQDLSMNFHVIVLVLLQNTTTTGLKQQNLKPLFSILVIINTLFCLQVVLE